MSQLITRHRLQFWFGPAAWACVACALACAPSPTGMASAAEAERPAARTPRRAPPARPVTVVDPAVTPAGGHGCRDCGPAGCRPGHACGQRHHRDCRDGVCAPHCPVRPGTFGFYGTNWRRWPGQGVVPASHTTDAAPALPPRSEVPSADEESFKSKAGELPEPSADEDRKPVRGPQRSKPASEPAAQAPAPEPEDDAIEPPTRSQAPGRLPSREDRRAPEPPAAESAPAPRPEAKPAPKPRPQDEDLFDDKAARARRRFPAAFAGSAEVEVKVDSAEGIAPTSLEETPVSEARPRTQAVGRRPTPKPVPRVQFDPRAEGRTPAR